MDAVKKAAITALESGLTSGQIEVKTGVNKETVKKARQRAPVNVGNMKYDTVVALASITLKNIGGDE